MDVVIACTNKDSHLVVTLTGRWTPETGKYSTIRVKQLAIHHGINRILLDMTGIIPPDAEYTRFDTGVQVAKHFGYPFHIAAFGTQELVNHFSVNVASNRGVRLQVFTDEFSALEWLLSTKAVSTEEMRTLFGSPPEQAELSSAHKPAS